MPQPLENFDKSQEKESAMQKLMVILLFCFVLVPGVSCAADFGTALGIMDANRPPDALSASRGNTWVADPEGSSNNPACIAAGEPFRVSGSTNYIVMFFGNGPTVHSYETSIYAAIPFGGVAQLTLGNTQSGYAKTRMDGESVRFDHQPYFDIAYGLKVKESLLRDGDKLFVGVGGGVNWSKMGFASQGQQTFISRSRGVNLYTGVLYQPTDGLNFGASYSWSYGRNEDRDFGDVENITSSRYTSTIHQTRVGASWTVLPKFGTTVAVDVQYLSLGHINRIQPFAGIEQQIIKDRLFVYGGWADKGPTAGLGLYFKNGGMNVAYMHNSNPDLNPHLGRSQTVMATAFFKW